MTASCATSGRLPRVEEMTLDEKIGQMIVPAGHGVFMNATSPAWQRLERLVRRDQVGGVIWFVSNVYETAELNRRLQAEAKVPLLISADLEAGIGMRFQDTTFWPPAMAVAATGDPSLAEREGRAVAIEARAIGINQIFAPVADVNVDPDNPVINARSFGEDPQDVARFVTAFIKGVRSEGLLATAKHFPGHGDTHVDSHRSLPVLNVTRERLEATELVPFRAAVAAGVDAVMVGHLAVPSLDPTPAPPRLDQHDDNRYAADAKEITENGTVPATISRPLIEGLLRHDLGFQGLVVTDAFDMGGLTEHFEVGEAAVRAVEAGEDQIVMPLSTPRSAEAIKAAVASGRIPESRIDASVRRILAAKARVHSSVATPDELFRIVDSEESRKLAEEIAGKAITLVRDGGSLPIAKDARVVEVVISEFVEPTTPLWEIERELKSRLHAAPKAFLFDGKATEDDAKTVVEAAKDADVVLLALAIRAKSGAGTISIPPLARRLLDQLATTRARLVAVSFGTPYLLREVPSLPTYLAAYGIQPVLQIAAVRAIFGEAAITGKLPVTIPGMYPRGHGIEIGRR